MSQLAAATNHPGSYPHNPSGSGATVSTGNLRSFAASTIGRRYELVYVCVYVYVYMYVSMYVFIYVCMYVCMYCMCLCMYYYSLLTTHYSLLTTQYSPFDRPQWLERASSVLAQY